MSDQQPGEVTRLLRLMNTATRDKEVLEEAKERLFNLIYQDLRRIAAAQLSRERSNHTLVPTALVNEAYLRLAEGLDYDWTNRAQFMAVASKAMRRILIDHARARQAERRGADPLLVELPVQLTSREMSADMLVALDEAFQRLESMNPRHLRMVELRVFGGYSQEETARTLGVARETVVRDWRFVRRWLAAELGPAVDPPSG